MTTLALPARLDSTTAPRLYKQLSEYIGQDLILDASEVRHLGTLCLQVLLSAAKSWRKAGAGFAITGITPEAEAQLSVLGISRAQLMDNGHDN